MDVRKNIYETVFVLHPDMSEEDVETTIQNLMGVLEREGADILRVDRGGKRRLAYPIRRQRYGYYNLVHFRAAPGALTALERTYRLSDLVIRYLTVRFEKEERLTGFTRLAEDESRDDIHEGSRRSGRHEEPIHAAGETQNRQTGAAEISAVAETGEESAIAATASADSAEAEPSEPSMEQVSEGTG